MRRSVEGLMLLWLLISYEVLSQEVFTRCFEERNILYIYVAEAVNFFAARDDCEERGATLARISDDVEFAFAREFMDDTRFTLVNAWIGQHLYEF